MTARFFCDVCTDEVEEPSSKREFRTEVHLRKPVEGHTASRSVGIQIIRSIDGSWNAGHLCDRCLRAALKQVREYLS